MKVHVVVINIFMVNNFHLLIEISLANYVILWKQVFNQIFGMTLMESMLNTLAMILSVFCQFSFGHDIVCHLQFPFGHDIVCLLPVSLWPWYYLWLVSFPLAIILSVFCQFPFGHDIGCLLSFSLWPWYCLSFVSFPLTMILSVFCHFPYGHDIGCLCQFPFGNDIICI
jgi:hypothetical protein